MLGLLGTRFHRDSCAQENNVTMDVCDKTVLVTLSIHCGRVKLGTMRQRHEPKRYPNKNGIYLPANGPKTNRFILSTQQKARMKEMAGGSRSEFAAGWSLIYIHVSSIDAPELHAEHSRLTIRKQRCAARHFVCKVRFVDWLYYSENGDEVDACLIAISSREGVIAYCERIRYLLPQSAPNRSSKRK